MSSYFIWYFVVCFLLWNGVATRLFGLAVMAALRVSAVLLEKGSGVLEGVAKSRIARDEPCLAASAGAPPERRHQ